MEFKRRNYQEAAIEAAMRDLRSVGRALWVMPTGAGKAYCLARVALDFLKINKHSRVLVVIDQSVLVEQLTETFSRVFGNYRISIACRGISKDIDEGAKVIIGTRQTLSSADLLNWKFDLLICDEVHEWKLMETGREDLGDGQFFGILSKLMSENPDLKILGCTATPFRLKDGWIFGTENRHGFSPIFQGISYKITYAKLFESKHLVSPKFYKIDAGLDRSSLSVSSSSGDFTRTSSSKACSRHAKNAAKAYVELLSGHRHTIAFCADTKHCEAVFEALSGVGVRGYVYNSKVKDKDAVLSLFRSNGGCLITVDMASKGFDFPCLSGALLLRPTNSVAITIQQIGRLLRLSEGKTEAVVVDLVGNTSAHLENNDLDRPIVPVPPPPVDELVEQLELQRKKACGNWPTCRELSTIRTKVCPACGYRFGGITDYDGEELGELVLFGHGQTEPTELLIKYPDVKFFITPAGGRKKMLSVTFSSLSGRKRRVNLFFPDSYGFKNGIVLNSKRVFRKLTGLPAPNSTDLAAAFKPLELESVTLSIKSGHWTVRDVAVK